MKNFISSYDFSFLEEKEISDILFFHLQKITDDSNKIKLEDIRNLYKGGFINRNTLAKKIKHLEDRQCLQKTKDGYILHLKAIIDNENQIIINKKEGELLLAKRKPNLIKLYSYLIYLNYTKKNEFSIASLISLLGYNNTGRCYKVIQSLLLELKETGLIDYSNHGHNYTLTRISHKSLVAASLFKTEPKLNKFCTPPTIYIPLTPKFMQGLSYYGEKIYIWMQLNGETNNKLVRIKQDILIEAYKAFYIRKSVFKKHIDELCRLKLVNIDEDYYVIEYVKVRLGASVMIPKQRTQKLFDLNTPRCVTIYSYLSYVYWAKRKNKTRPYVFLNVLCRKIGLPYNENNLLNIRYCLAQLTNMNLIHIENSTTTIDGKVMKVFILNEVTLPLQLC